MKISSICDGNKKNWDVVQKPPLLSTQNVYLVISMLKFDVNMNARNHCTQIGLYVWCIHLQKLRLQNEILRNKIL